MFRLIAAAVLAASVAGSAANAANCMRDVPNQRAAGRLTIRQFDDDPIERTEQAYILSLRRPVCLTDSTFGDVAKAREIHLFSTTESVRRTIARSVGSVIAVRGTPFGAHTAHHHAPIVMDVSEIAARSGHFSKRDPLSHP
jgi:hypothetical protein